MNLQNEESTIYKSEFINAYDKTKMYNSLQNSLSGRSSRNLNELAESSNEIQRFESNVKTLEDIFKEKNDAKRRQDNLAKRTES